MFIQSSSFSVPESTNTNYFPISCVCCCAHSLVRTFISFNNSLTDTLVLLPTKPLHTSHPDTSFCQCFSSSRSSDPALFSSPNLHAILSQKWHCSLPSYPPPFALLWPSGCFDSDLLSWEELSGFPGVKSYYCHERPGETVRQFVEEETLSSPLLHVPIWRLLIERVGMLFTEWGCTVRMFNYMLM